jgi:RNA polymerase subunit RPABC4/transcription elongation factor Spt4
VILLYSATIVALAMSQAPGWKVCDYCHGTGKITTEEACPTCLGSGSVTATIEISGISTWKSDDSTKIYVSAAVVNKENAAVYGTFTATMEAAYKKYETTPRAVTLAANERTTLTFTMDNIPPEDIYRADPGSAHVLVSNLPTVACSTCNGTGVVSVESTCPVCSGTGFVPVDGGQQNGNGNGNTNAPPLDISVPAIGVGAVAVVAVAAVVVVKKRKVSEKDLRKLPPTEFQNWVLKKLAGKPSSSRDSSIGIDGYTTEGHPISIKQSDGVGRDVIDKFASAIGQSRAKNGILIAYSFGNDAYTAKVKAKLNYGLEIQLVTLKELIESGKKPL